MTNLKQKGILEGIDLAIEEMKRWENLCLNNGRPRCSYHHNPKVISCSKCNHYHLPKEWLIKLREKIKS